MKPRTFESIAICFGSFLNTSIYIVFLKGKKNYFCLKYTSPLAEFRPDMTFMNQIVYGEMPFMNQIVYGEMPFMIGYGEMPFMNQIVYREMPFMVSKHIGGLESLFFINVNQVLEITNLTKFHPYCVFCDIYSILPTQCNRLWRNAFYESSSGLYLASFAGAVREALQKYPRTVNDLEFQLLDNPHMSLTDINLALDPIKPMLTSINALISKIEHRHVRGCSILEAIHKHTSSSVEQTMEIMISVEQQVMNVLYEQLRRWLLHADLLDPHNEFFIQVRARMASAGKLQCLNGQSLTGKKIIMFEGKSQCLKVSYQLVPELLPEHIPLHTAEKILFIGESIQVFEQKGKTIDGHNESWPAPDFNHDLNNRNDNIGYEGLGYISIFKMVMRLFQVQRTFVKNVLQHLLSLVLEAGFVSELSDLRAVFLLERGELYQAFLPMATPLLTMPHNTIHTSKLNRLFQLAGQQVLLEECLMKKFSLTYRPPDKSERPSDITNGDWRGLRLQYNASWPLHKMFTTAVQDKYNAVFSFLLDVRRAQQRLQQLWIIRMADKTVRMTETESVHWTLRHQMGLLVDNIQYYLQVDVLASESSVLLEAVSIARDYQHLETSHQAFLAAITHQCFLNNKIVSKCLNNLLTLVHNFCNVLESLNISKAQEKKVDRGCSVTGSAQVRSSQKRVQEINSEFEVVAAQLFWVLSLQRSKHTTQLIMRIDYNKYYTKNTQC
ncbi:unnamed protein product, partial [Meganyctiphanes norvegica]